MEIKDIVGKKVAIWCDTEEKANDFLFKVKDFTKSKQDSNYFTNYVENTCYHVYSYGYTYSEKQYCEREGYEIISYNDFFGISEQVESETLTTVEVLEWLGKNYFSKEYPKIFGKSYSMDRLIGDLGAEEVIKRITDYELEQRKAKVSDEEITLLLDEKYGVGKWVRNVKKETVKKEEIAEIETNFIKCISGLVVEDYKNGYLEALNHVKERCK